MVNGQTLSVPAVAPKDLSPGSGDGSAAKRTDREGGCDESCREDTGAQKAPRTKRQGAAPSDARQSARGVPGKHIRALASQLEGGPSFREVIQPSG